MHATDLETAPSAADVKRRREEAHRLGERIAVLAAHIHAATYRMLVLLREFDDRHGWDGWKTCAQWLSWRTGISLEAAREKVRVAKALPNLPRIAASFERGELSYSKVRAMTRIATPRTEESLLNVAIHGTAAQLERVVRGYRRADPEREVARANLDHERRYLGVRRDEHGNVAIEGRLPAELGTRFLKALDAAADAARATGEDPAADPRSFGQLRADALVLLSDSALAADLPGRRASDTHQVVVHVDSQVLADPAADGRSELEDGSHVSAETARRLACDASMIEIREDENGDPLSVRRRRRTVPPSLRRALASRDPGCRFPGCHHTRHLEAHHIEHWADGGATALPNLVHLCSFHHRQLHEGGFRVETGPGGELAFRNGHGLIVAAPQQAGSLDELVEELRDLELSAGTLPLWNGDPVDYGLAISGLFDVERRDLERPARGSP